MILRSGFHTRQGLRSIPAQFLLQVDVAFFETEAVGLRGKHRGKRHQHRAFNP